MKKVLPKTKSNTHLFPIKNEECGLNTKSKSLKDKRPLYIFEKLFSPLINVIIESSNDYLKYHPELIKTKTYYEIDFDDIMMWLGCYFTFGIVRFSNREDYWKNDELEIFGNNFIKSLMTKKKV